MANCCDECLNLTFDSCLVSIDFDVTSLPNQDVTLIVTNIATGRANSFELEAVGGEILFDSQDFDIPFVPNQTYKAQIKDESGTVIEFDSGAETYNCLQFKIKPTYEAVKPHPHY